ncbi:MAG: hypothetical protein HC785_07345 [Calothrix sp. CSU_2_0]|nr:hypothetical protein [Calothrix sp. CSU_2_0]
MNLVVGKSRKHSNHSTSSQRFLHLINYVLLKLIARDSRVVTVTSYV